MFNKVFLQRIVYRNIREKFNLAAQLAARVRSIPITPVGNALNAIPLTGKNSPERSLFMCISCGLEGEADFIASLNIRNRAAVNQPIAAGAIFDRIDLPAASQRASAVGS